MKLSYWEILGKADKIYSEMLEEQGRKQHHTYGIESSQVKAMLKALVEAINKEQEKPFGEPNERIKEAFDRIEKSISV